MERCAADIYRQISDGSLDFAKVFIKTDVHPQAAGTYQPTVPVPTKLCIGLGSSFLLPVLENTVRYLFYATVRDIMHFMNRR